MCLYKRRRGLGPHNSQLGASLVFSFQSPSHHGQGPQKTLFSSWFYTFSKCKDLTREAIPGSSLSHHRHRPIRDVTVFRDLF